MNRNLATPASDAPHHNTFNQTLDNEQSLQPLPDLSDPQRPTNTGHTRNTRMRQTDSQRDPSDVAFGLPQPENPCDLPS